MAAIVNFSIVRRMIKSCARPIAIYQQHCNVSKISRDIRPLRYKAENYDKMKGERSMKQKRKLEYLFRREPRLSSRHVRDQAIPSQSKVNYYTKKINLLIDEGRVKEAGLLLQDKNISQDITMFNMVMCAYGRQGNLKMALSLYNFAKSNNFHPNGYTYTGLLNMHADNPERTNSSTISKIYTEMTQMIDSDTLLPNIILYNAAIKAFSRCGDVPKAFAVYEDLCYKGLEPDRHTFAMLLIGCIQVKSASSKVLDVLNEMQTRNIRPNIYLYNLLLRVFRDFKQNDHVGRNTFVKDAVLGIDMVTRSQRQARGDDKRSSSKAVFPGVESFLKMMEHDEVSPNIITCFFLSQLSENDDDIEIIFKIMERFRIVPDLLFMNSVIRGLAWRGHVKSAKKYFDQLEKWNLKADYSTYLSLAYTCQQPEDGLRLLDRVKTDGFLLSPAIFDTLVTVAARSDAYQYLVILMKRMLLEKIEPDPRILSKLHGIATNKKFVNKRKAVSTKDFIDFCDYLTLWRKTFSKTDNL